MSEQEKLNELLDRFKQEHPELDAALKVIPNPPLGVDPGAFSAAVSVGTSTKPSGLAFLGTSSSTD